MAISSVNPFTNGRTAGHMPVFGQKMPVMPPVPQNNTEKTAAPTNNTAKTRHFDDRTAGMAHMNANAKPDDFSFFDLLDIINPLQHIPIVSSIYRNVTGDEIKPAARAIGGFLFGGPLGLATGIVNGAMASTTGRDLPETLVASVTTSKTAPKTPIPTPLSGANAFLAQHYSQTPHNTL
jgi:hypothetical protein